MKIKEKYTTEVLRWDFKKYGLFESTLIDGKLHDLRFCHSGSLLGPGLFAGENDTDFIKCIYKALGELLEKLKLLDS